MYKTIVKVQIVRETMHQNDRRRPPFILPRETAVAPTFHRVLDKWHHLGVLKIPVRARRFGRLLPSTRHARQVPLVAV